MASPSFFEPKKPRLVTVHKKGRQSFGFNLHGLKGKPGQTVKSVDETGAAHEAGVLAGDRILGVDLQSVLGETHSMVVDRIRRAQGKVTILLLDEESYDYYNARGIPIDGGDAVHLSNEEAFVPREDILVVRTGMRTSSSSSPPVSPPLSPTALPQATATHSFVKRKISKRDEAKQAKADWAARMAAFDNM